MVDGYGDGLVIECGTEDVDYLRTTSFGLLQVRSVWAGRVGGCRTGQGRGVGRLGF